MKHSFNKLQNKHPLSEFFHIASLFQKIYIPTLVVLRGEKLFIWKKMKRFKNN